MPYIPPNTTCPAGFPSCQFLYESERQGHLQPDHAPEPRGANQQGGDGGRSAPLKAGAGIAQRGLFFVQVVTLTLTLTLTTYKPGPGPWSLQYPTLNRTRTRTGPQGADRLAYR
jgi:hypothetical protein